MPTLTLPASSFAWGEEDASFNSPDTSFSVQGSAADGYAGWSRHVGLSVVLAGGVTIVSATLTISSIDAGGSPPATDETFQVYAEAAVNPTLPADGPDSASRVRTSNSTITGSLNGLSSIPMNVKTIIEERASTGGDVMQFVITNPSYSGTGLDTMTAELVVVYEESGPYEPPATPPYSRQRLVNVNQAVPRAAHY